MNEELQNQLVSLIEGAKQAGSDAASFIQQQAPEFIEQLIKWQIVDGISTFAFSALILVGSAIVMKKFMARCGDWSDFTFEQIVTIAAGICLVVSLFATATLGASGLKRAAKAYFAPKVVVMEMIQKTIK